MAAATQDSDFTVDLSQFLSEEDEPEDQRSDLEEDSEDLAGRKKSAQQPTRKKQKTANAAAKAPTKKAPAAVGRKVANKGRQQHHAESVTTVEDQSSVVDQASEQGIGFEIPKGHRSLGELKGVSVKQNYANGPFCGCLHWYKMRKDAMGSPMLDPKTGKIALEVHKTDYALNSQQLGQLYRQIPSIVKEIRRCEELTGRYNKDGNNSQSRYYH